MEKYYPRKLPTEGIVDDKIEDHSGQFTVPDLGVSRGGRSKSQRSIEMSASVRKRPTKLAETLPVEGTM